MFTKPITNSSQSPLSLQPNFVPGLSGEDNSSVIRVRQYPRTVEEKVAELININQKERRAEDTALQVPYITFSSPLTQFSIFTPCLLFWK